MKETAYGMPIRLTTGFDDAVARTTAALKLEGFGVLTEIDVQATLRAKLDADFRPYTILGACSPPLAKRALTADLDVGLLLPCNVIVYEDDDGRAVVTAMAPMAALGSLGGNPELTAVAREAQDRLRRAVLAIEASPQS